MNFFFWLVSYYAALLLEASFLPHVFGAAVPAVSNAVLLMGIARQRFLPALWFAGVSGVGRDIVFPTAAGSHAAYAISSCGIMHLFIAFALWDEPLRQIGAVVIGLLGAPAAWFASALVGHAFFGQDASASSGLLDFGQSTVNGLIFAAFWVSIFAWLVIRAAARRRRERLLML